MKKVSNIRLKGHETFILREGWLNKGLKAVAENPRVFFENSGADALGVGTNMAKAIRYWLKSGGMTTESPAHGVMLTQTGQLIYEKDPYLEDDFALWIFHCNLVCDIKKATSWYLFFQEFELEEFTRDELFVSLKHLVLQYAGVEEVSERSLHDDCTAILSMYYQEKLSDYDPEEKKISPFAKLELLKKEGAHFRKTQPFLALLNEKVVLYLIVQYFQRECCNSVSIDDLLKKPYLPGRVLHLKRAALNDYLDRLSARNYLSVNRTAGLDMVYQKKELSPLKVIEMYYSGN